MQKREDFDYLLLETINCFFNGEITICRIKNEQNWNTMFTYSLLNSIVSINPSLKVKNFIKTEYQLREDSIRKMVVKIYVGILLSSRGILSSGKLYLNVSSKMSIDDILIYPCNKKIRLFDFKNDSIYVLPKIGFPTKGIDREIEFRTQNTQIAVLPLQNIGKHSYKETIIDGNPLARVGNKQRYDELKLRSLQLLREMNKSSIHQICVEEYNKSLNSRVSNLTVSIEQNNNELRNRILILSQKYCNLIKNEDFFVELTLSHGDFHHGNIWVENKTDLIKIIDWESVSTRTKWYDLFTLYGGLREINGIHDLFESIKYKTKLKFEVLLEYANPYVATLEVLFEDLVYRLDDFSDLPFSIGIVELESYISMIEKEFCGL
jgi:hypothetical protein